MKAYLHITDFTNLLYWFRYSLIQYSFYGSFVFCRLIFLIDEPQIWHD